MCNNAVISHIYVNGDGGFEEYSATLCGIIQLKRLSSKCCTCLTKGLPKSGARRLRMGVLLLGTVAECLMLLAFRVIQAELGSPFGCQSSHPGL